MSEINNTNSNRENPSNTRNRMDRNNCPKCGYICEKVDFFCSNCGAKMRKGHY